MNDNVDKSDQVAEPAADKDAAANANERSEEPQAQASASSGPTFTEAPDPLAGPRQWLGGIMDSMDGKSVSMKTYVFSIIGVIALMMLARCGG